MKEKIDGKFMGWVRTIWEIVGPLIPFRFGKWYIHISIPRFVASYRILQYIIKRSEKCLKCNSLTPPFQLGSSEDSRGVTCSKCENMPVKEIYDAKT